MTYLQFGLSGLVIGVVAYVWFNISIATVFNELPEDAKILFQKKMGGRVWGIREGIFFLIIVSFIISVLSIIWGV
jgi:hypothetical protein